MTNRFPTESHDGLLNPVQLAAYQLVHEFRARNTRGAAALAPLVGMHPGTLANKVNPMQDASLTLAESMQLQAAAQDYRVLHAYALALGHAAYQLPDSLVSDLELLTKYSEYHERIGAQSAAIRRALSDGRVTQEEVFRIRQDLQGVIAAGLALQARFDAIAE